MLQKRNEINFALTDILLIINLIVHVLLLEYEINEIALKFTKAVDKKCLFISMIELSFLKLFIWDVTNVKLDQNYE